GPASEADRWEPRPSPCLRREGEQIVGGLAGSARRTKDRALIPPQHFEPATDIIGMAHGRADRQRSTGKGARHLRNQFLARIGAAAEAARLVAGQTAPVSGPVAQLVQRGAMPVDGLAKR